MRRATTSTATKKKKTIVVAGGAGFLGSHLCDRLVQAGHRVYCVDSFYTGRASNLSELERATRFTLIEQDVREPLPELLRADEIYNLACPASPPHYQADPVHTLMTSVVGTHNLLTHAVATGARFLQASTSEVYGDPDIHPQPESYWGNVNPTGPRACYDEGKRAAEALCFDHHRLGLAEVRVARIFNTYGPRMRADDGRIVSNLVTQALSGLPMTIYGDGLQTRSFCYVSDLVEGLIRLMGVEEALPGAVNLGNPGEFTVLELAHKIAELTGSSSPIVHEPLPQDDPRRRRPDIALAREYLGWAPGVSLDEGLGPTVAWFAAELERSETAAARKRGRADVLPNGRAQDYVAPPS